MSAKDHLLVVDDEEMNRNILLRRLERSGFQVEVACCGGEALGKVDAGTFDLVLLDQMMPEKSGSEVLREIRTRFSASELPVIMVTAVTESTEVAGALDLGANDYITKPVDFTVALARIRAQLSRKHAEAARRISEERYELAARAANDGLWDWDLGSNQIYYSARWKQMMGLREDEIGNSPEEWFSRVHADDLVALRLSLQSHLDGQTDVFESEYRIRRMDGHYRWMVGRGMVLRGADGAPSRMAGSQSDITDRKTLDVLTGLPNRLLFEERLTAAVDAVRHDPDFGFALYFVDLDRFKLVNDTVGHLGGDQLLIQFAARLRSVAAAETAGAASAVTNWIAARMSGDEFAVLLEGVRTPASACAFADRLVRAMRTPFQLEGQEFFSSASAGIVLSGPVPMSPDDLIRDADIAMYAAKARGRARWAIFDESMRRRAIDRMEIERDMRTALSKGQFVVYYQPRVDLRTEQICGFEALLRWKHPVRGVLSPELFIDIAEETGMIREIGLWALGEACDQMRRWRDEFPEMSWLDVAVNVSPAQLRDNSLVPQIAQILAETGLEPSGLQIEVTETTLFENLEEARNVLMAVKDLGVGLKLDDFATGYSCLRYLYRLPFDTIKIDRSFTMDLDDQNAESRELIRTILAMAQNLNLGVIAEGVETRASVDFLREQGCKFGQGYFFSPPITAEGIENLLLKGLPR